eukprot:Lankesteria_metandrocarpae@DN1199_c0_g1_i9.p1
MIDDLHHQQSYSHSSVYQRGQPLSGLPVGDGRGVGGMIPIEPFTAPPSIATAMAAVQGVSYSHGHQQPLHRSDNSGHHGNNDGYNHNRFSDQFATLAERAKQAPLDYHRHQPPPGDYGNLPLGPNSNKPEWEHFGAWLEKRRVARESTPVDMTRIWRRSLSPNSDRRERVVEDEAEVEKKVAWLSRLQSATGQAEAQQALRSNGSSSDSERTSSISSSRSRSKMRSSKRSSSRSKDKSKRRRLEGERKKSKDDSRRRHRSSKRNHHSSKHSRKRKYSDSSSTDSEADNSDSSSSDSSRSIIHRRERRSRYRTRHNTLSKRSTRAVVVDSNSTTYAHRDAFEIDDHQSRTASHTANESAIATAATGATTAATATTTAATATTTAATATTTAATGATTAATATTTAATGATTAATATTTAAT